MKAIRLHVDDGAPRTPQRALLYLITLDEFGHPQIVGERSPRMTAARSISIGNLTLSVEAVEI